MTLKVQILHIFNWLRIECVTCLLLLKLSIIKIILSFHDFFRNYSRNIYLIAIGKIVISKFNSIEFIVNSFRLVFFILFTFLYLHICILYLF